MAIIILDRDGVINEDSVNYIKSATEWNILPGVLEALQIASISGFKLFIASNQSGLSKRLFSSLDLVAIHKKLGESLKSKHIPLEGIFFCPHTSDDLCACRKPLPLMLHTIQERYPEKEKAYFVGDSWRDLVAAYQGGCIPVLVKTGNGEKTYQRLLSPNSKEEGTVLESTKVFDTLLDFVSSLNQ